MNRLDLLEALNHVDEMQIESAGQYYEVGTGRKSMKKRIHFLRIALIAAAIAAMLGISAYATGVFSLRTRMTEPEETFPVHFRGTEGGEEAIEGYWPGTFVLEFESLERCQPVRYRFGWLPETAKLAAYCVGEDGWIERRDWDGITGFIPWGEHAEILGDDKNLFLIGDMYYAPQFANGGALILMDAVPEEVTEETWGEISVVKIQSERYQNLEGKFYEYNDGLIRNYLVLFHQEEGWILALRGTFPMEELIKIAKHTEVVQTEGVVERSQFENPYCFFDVARG